jgi:DNA-binding CsgD family transcriptional regulator
MTATEPTPEAFAGPLGAQLRRRIQQASDEAERLLELPGDPGREPDLERLRALIAALDARLPATTAAGEGSAARDQADALDRLRQRFDTRFDALARVQSVIGELREITSPSAMLTRAPAALCEGSTMKRAILSLVRGGRMIAESVYFSGDARGAGAVREQLRANPLRLEHPLIETELLRRRRATIVLDAHLHPRVDDDLARLMEWRSYAAAPLVIGSQVIGVIHADRGPEAKLDVLDRDVLWEFTSGLGQAYENATLRRMLRHEREQTRQFLEWLGARSGELTDAPVTLAAAQYSSRSPSQQLEEPAPPEGRDDRMVFEGLLTRRELDVLRLLAEGHSNRELADALVISTGTVKFHVNGILRKLRVANRAEAVSRYLRLLGMRAP